MSYKRGAPGDATTSKSSTVEGVGEISGNGRGGVWVAYPCSARPLPCGPTFLRITQKAWDFFPRFDLVGGSAFRWLLIPSFYKPDSPPQPRPNRGRTPLSAATSQIPLAQSAGHASTPLASAPLPSPESSRNRSGSNSYPPLACTAAARSQIVPTSAER